MPSQRLKTSLYTFVSVSEIQPTHFHYFRSLNHTREGFVLVPSRQTAFLLGQNDKSVTLLPAVFRASFDPKHDQKAYRLAFGGGLHV